MQPIENISVKDEAWCSRSPSVVCNDCLYNECVVTTCKSESVTTCKFESAQQCNIASTCCSFCLTALVSQGSRLQWFGPCFARAARGNREQGILFIKKDAVDLLTHRTHEKRSAQGTASTLKNHCRAVLRCAHPPSSWNACPFCTQKWQN